MINRGGVIATNINLDFYSIFNTPIIHIVVAMVIGKSWQLVEP